jgi:hypothetical protein
VRRGKKRPRSTRSAAVDASVAIRETVTGKRVRQHKKVSDPALPDIPGPAPLLLASASSSLLSTSSMAASSANNVVSESQKQKKVRILLYPMNVYS